MLGFSPIGSAPLGGLAVAQAVDPSVAIDAGWIEGDEQFQAALSVANLTGVTAVMGWSEESDSSLIAIEVDAPEYARAPEGAGYQPRRGARQNRPPALQGYYE